MIENPTCTEESFFAVLTNRDLLKHIVSFQGGRKWDDIHSGDWCLKHKHYSLVKEKYLLYSSKSSYYLAKSNKLSWLMQLCAQGLQCTQKTMDVAAEYNHFEMLQYIFLNFPSLSLNNVSKIAIRLGHDAILHWSLLVDTKKSYTGIMDEACACGNLETMVWLSETYDLKCTRNSSLRAAKKGHLKVLQWIFLNQPSKIATGTLEEAAAAGHLLVVVWLCSIVKNTMCTRAIQRAARNGHFHIVQWFHENTTDPWNKDVADDAVASGNFKLMKWIMKNKHFHCTKKAMYLACCRSDLKIAKYLSNKYSFPLEDVHFNEALKTGNTPMLDWMYKRGLRMNSSTVTIDFLASTGCIASLQWCHEHNQGVFSKSTMDCAAAHGQYDTVLWLHKNRKEGCSTDAMDEAATHGHLAMVQWFDRNRSEGYTYRAFCGAAKEGHYDVVLWLFRNKKQECTIEDKIPYNKNNLDLHCWFTKAIKTTLLK